MNTTSREHTLDVMIVGAGISGIGMACNLQDRCPDMRYALFERRDDIGGTWDLFRYPGIRSDSDMFSFGYKFRPWQEPKILSDGPSIKQYLDETAREFGVMDRIHFGRTIRRADWSSADGCWQVDIEDRHSGAIERWQARFLVTATGYYRYDAGHTPDFPGRERFQGTFIHPQQWPEDLDYRDKRVVVIGSGATSITLVPAMAGTARHVTMLQRSPSYVLTVPAIDWISKTLQRLLPQSWVFNWARERNIGIQRFIYQAARRYPKIVRRVLLASVRVQLRGKVDMRHFSPSYKPWDERLCVVPNGDLFTALRSDKADIVTDHIETFTETGIRLKSGQELAADIVISATGLNMEMLGGIDVRIDGEPQPLADRMTYKGVLLEGVPNMANIFGYVNASWTLKADLSSIYLCRLIEYMREHGLTSATPLAKDAEAEDRSVMDALASNYVQRASHALPRQGDRYPWQVTHDFKADKPMLTEAPIDDGVLVFDADRKQRRDAA